MQRETWEGIIDNNQFSHCTVHFAVANELDNLSSN